MSDDQDGCEWVNVFFWYRPTRVVTDKRPLNGCVCVFNSVPVITFQYLLRLPEKGDTKLGAVCLNCQPIFEIFSLSRFFSKFTAK